MGAPMTGGYHLAMSRVSPFVNVTYDLSLTPLCASSAVPFRGWLFLCVSFLIVFVEHWVWNPGLRAYQTSTYPETIPLVLFCLLCGPTCSRARRLAELFQLTAPAPSDAEAPCCWASAPPLMDTLWTSVSRGTSTDLTIQWASSK